MDVIESYEEKTTDKAGREFSVGIYRLKLDLFVVVRVHPELTSPWLNAFTDRENAEGYASQKLQEMKEWK